MYFYRCCYSDDVSAARHLFSSRCVEHAERCGPLRNMNMNWYISCCLQPAAIISSLTTTSETTTRWQEPSKQQESQLEARLLASSWPPRPLANLPRQLEASRSRTDTDLVTRLAW